MRIPVIRGVIDRRILVNYRVEEDVATRFLPRPFRPKLVQGMGMAGVCLIRLKRIRPRFWPGFLGISSENAAYRIAVQWEHAGRRHEGVFIPRRDTSSWLNTFAGGKLFPGEHHHSRFRIEERDDRYRVVVDSDDQRIHLAIEGHVARELPSTSVFTSVRQASDFFEQGSLGYSATARPGHFDGLELCSFNWQVQPLAIDRAESSFFDDHRVFPPGSVHLDSALVMRGIDHEWHGREPLCVETDRAPSEPSGPQLTTMARSFR
jgi:hypothetical protein